ncbi:MAG: hypothetical protein K2N13_06450 [Paraprevotella sp.]|nr:hypothetical protein [Paraprevotella sp.]
MRDCKKVILYMVAGSLLLTSCGSAQQLQGVSAGTTIGTVLGSSIGGIMGGFRGHDVGTLVGAVAGGAVGAAITAPRERRKSVEPDAIVTERTAKKHTKKSSVSSRSVMIEAEDSSGVALTAPVAESPLVLRNLRYIDDGRNQILNRKESSKLIFELVNSTHIPVTGVVPYVSEANGNEQVYISPPVRIERIEPGEVIRYTVEIKGGNRLKAGTAVFRIAVSCDDGPFVTVREFTLPTDK